jgi:hypothetical protein
MSGPYANLLTESPAPGELVSVGTGAEENTRHFVIFALTRATAWTRFSIHFFLLLYRCRRWMETRRARYASGTGSVEISWLDTPTVR